MAWTKAKTAIIVGAGVLLAAGITTTAVLKAKAQADLKKDPVAYEILHRSLLQQFFPPRFDDSATRQQLVGVWAIQAKKFGSNPKFTRYPKDNHRLKTWTLTNWSIITYDAKSNIVYSASGPYELEGDLYTETIESATGTMTNYIGAHPQYRLRVNGDKYYQMSPSLEEMGQRVPQ